LACLVRVLFGSLTVKSLRLSCAWKVVRHSMQGLTIFLKRVRNWILNSNNASLPNQ
jgi:hypothetical protein